MLDQLLVSNNSSDHYAIREELKKIVLGFKPDNEIKDILHLN